MYASILPRVQSRTTKLIFIQTDIYVLQYDELKTLRSAYEVPALTCTLGFTICPARCV